jgi:hypothetical protein
VQTTVDALVPIHVRRARSKRLTGWLVECEDHGNVTPVMRSKAKAGEQAQMHGTAQHQGRCRIQSPRL